MLLDIGELGGLDGAVLVLVEDQDVDDADGSGVDELEELRAISPVKFCAPAGNSTTR